MKRKIENRKTSRYKKSTEITSKEISSSIHSKSESTKFEEKKYIFEHLGQTFEASPSEQVTGIHDVGSVFSYECNIFFHGLSFFSWTVVVDMDGSIDQLGLF